MKDIYTEEYFRRILGKELSDSDVIDRKLRKTYRQIGRMKKRRPFMRKAGYIAAGTAAAFILSVVFCVSNPVLAAKLPIIGRIFKAVEGLVSYGGDYSSRAEMLAEPKESAASENGTDEQNAGGASDRGQRYVQESGGIRITASEAYYDSMALYLAFSIENEQGFPADFIKRENMEGYSLDYDRLELVSTAEFDFTAAGLGKYTCDPAEGTAAPYYIEGRYEDRTTFAGIIRVDLEEQFIQIPEQFSYSLRITDIWSDLFETEEQQLHGPDGMVTVNEPVQKHYEGNWAFTFDVALDTANTTVLNVNDVNEAGFGIGAVTKTLYELKADPILPEGASSADYVTAICDADGELLDAQGDSAEVYSIYGRNTDEITVYICDYMTFMDECRGENAWRLPEKAVYAKELRFK